MRVCYASVSTVSHGLSAFLILPVVLLVEGEQLPVAGGLVSLRRSFFSPQRTAQATADASINFWVCASSARIWSSHSLTSKVQVARLVVTVSLRLRLSLRSGWRLDCSWTLSWALVRALLRAEVVRIVFTFLTSIFQSMKMQLPWVDERINSRMS